MTDRLTDDEIKALRELRLAASALPWRIGSDYNKPEACGQEGCIHDDEGLPILESTHGALEGDAAYAAAACNAIDRLLDEIEERRRVERFVAAEVRKGLDKEEWDGHLQPEPFDAAGNPWCPTCKVWHERSPGTMLWIKCKDGGA